MERLRDTPQSEDNKQKRFRLESELDLNRWRQSFIDDD